jgi:outer membrane receptor protein involved in Fe transport
MKPVFNSAFLLSPLALAISLSAHAETEIKELDAVTVTADFRQTEVQSIPEAVTVVGEAQIEQRNGVYLDEVLALAPNINSASGSSRGKYFQVRGIGERSQFVEPLNPSVGTYIDGLDFTGFAGAATLLDVQQVEVLRGSQGTRFGANSLAGVINIRSNEPTAESQGYVKAYLEDYNGRGIQAAHGGSVAPNLQYRVALGHSQSDGFIKNTTLDKKNTNNIDELTSKLKLRWLASEDLTLDLTALYVDVDNGYDAFNFDENRKTRSNEPGHDRQESKALALDSDWKMNDAVNMEASLTASSSDIEYGYDEDWTGKTLNPDYQVFDNYQRDVDRNSAEVRWLSGNEGRLGSSDWLVGLYHQQSQVDLTRNRTGKSEFTSEYKTESTSAYVEINTPLTENLMLSYGGRAESWFADYKDSKKLAGDNNESLYGGKIALEYITDDADLVYASLTRGYKAGGFNGTEDLPNESDRSFDTEYQWNYEIGTKLDSHDGRFQNRIAVFYIDRKDLQLKSSTPKSDGNGGTEFIDFITNAGKGFSYGLEWEALAKPMAQLELTLSLGLLKTEVTEHKNPNKDEFSLKGRETAHAPEYTYATAAKYLFTDNWYARVEVEGRDDFYYSDSHNFQSNEYDVVNARVGYQAAKWEVALYGKNLTNEKYGVRGFAGWDADPRTGPGFDEKQFEQLAAPAVVGIATRVNF